MNKNNGLLIFLLSILLTGCISYPSRCEITSLLLFKDILPSGTFIEQVESPLIDYPEESAANSFYFSPDYILHEVVKWPTTNAATKEYTLNVKSAFDVDRFRGPWTLPDNIYISKLANNYQVGCGTDGNIYQCRMVATYGEYSVLFRSWVSEEGITMSIVNELLKDIDERMIQCTK